jgi:hypothetical protein
MPVTVGHASPAGSHRRRRLPAKKGASGRKRARFEGVSVTDLLRQQSFRALGAYKCAHLLARRVAAERAGSGRGDDEVRAPGSHNAKIRRVGAARSDGTNWHNLALFANGLRGKSDAFRRRKLWPRNAL